MKTKLFISLVFISLTTTVFAQFDPEHHTKNEWGFAAAINSTQAQVEIPILYTTGSEVIDADGNILTGGDRVDKSYSFSIIPKYHIKNDLLLRFEFGITNLNLQADNDAKYGNTHSISNRKITSNIFRYTPGFQWTFIKTRRLESYCGITASYINYKSVNDNAYNEIRDLATDTVKQWIRDKATTPGGFAIGIGALAGFNIYLYKRISLGAEFSSSALYYKFGGETTTKTSAQIIHNPVDTNTETFTNSYKGFKISKIISSFNISYWF